MDKCILIKPDISFKNDIQALRQEILNDGSSKYETGPFKRMDNMRNGWSLIRSVKIKKLFLKIGLLVNNSSM